MARLVSYKGYFDVAFWLLFSLLLRFLPFFVVFFGFFVILLLPWYFLLLLVLYLFNLLSLLLDSLVVLLPLEYVVVAVNAVVTIVRCCFWVCFTALHNVVCVCLEGYIWFFVVAGVTVVGKI